MKLNDITNYIQSICENISNVLNVDVTLVTKDLTRIAGTGIFRERIGEKISEEAVYSAVLREGNSYVIDKAVSISCSRCSHKDHCKELADICTPVKLGDDILGVLGIAAFDEEQKNNLLSKDKELTIFIKSMSDLISFRLDELYKQEVKTIDDLEKEAIINAIKKYGSNTEGMKKVADALEIGIATLYRKVKKFDIKY
ncbi:helix-turn-helix domain-containing protein [Asaccharospora irregularis]|uniref:Regulatory protein, Fis family n=1 Tax=Asaccharospora irregularis DSM 2635 TaxID=1121321 RepID=A0A1M5NAL8_9FIRM|nr:helix-turn-helix domain-containing protein [Asaccharospora irregularis]SHG86249.1 regulatory protein, Fis family [Asaccharospora irregularis DSM 2635]